jgi:hypothetical protein
MILAPIWRTRLYATGGSLLAVWLGFAVAQQELFWPLLFLAGIGALLVVRLQSLPLGTVLLGMAMLGYIVGNRGFAQLYIANSFPLLPAEFALLVGGVLLIVQCAFRRELPFRRDALSLALIAWIVICASRFLFDVRLYGFTAVRDFATVYYAGFFFLAQEAVREPAGRRYLTACLLAGCAILPLAAFLSEQFPMFFLNIFTLRGIPLVYYKGDLIGTFMAVGAVLFFMQFEARRQWWTLAASLGLIGAALATNNRASMLGLIIVTVLLAIGGRWRFAAVQVVAGTGAAICMLLVAHLTDRPWVQTPLNGLYERVISLADPLGEHTYSSEDAFDKGDNNLFRYVWWRAVVDETWGGNPYFGLGFGYDLADRFVQEYLPETGEEFSTRSPHNVLLTLFGRTGVAGLVSFLVVIGLMTQRTWRAIRHESSDNAGMWCGAWIILVSACFGVVLEGPMGAVVFWIMLGLANSASAADEPLPEAAAAIPAAGPAVPA